MIAAPHTLFSLRQSGAILPAVRQGPGHGRLARNSASLILAPGAFPVTSPRGVLANPCAGGGLANGGGVGQELNVERFLGLTDAQTTGGAARGSSDPSASTLGASPAHTDTLASPPA